MQNIALYLKVRHEYGKKLLLLVQVLQDFLVLISLAVDGYKVTVFEKQKALGGMLTLGIPSFRLGKRSSKCRNRYFEGIRSRI